VSPVLEAAAPAALPARAVAPPEVSRERRDARARPVEIATVHALTWLVAACGVGLLLSLLLLFPRLGALLGPLTYGRWTPLHLDLVLYGWTALPLVALLLRAYLPPEDEATARAAGIAVQVWSGSLVAGAVSWLAGRTTGKPFLDWEGFARVSFLASLALLAAVLAAGLVRRRERSAGLAALWLALLAVPGAMALATSPRTYPPINPDTGGPTGASLLGSTLCVIAIFVATPWLLGLPGTASRRARRARIEVLGALAAHSLFFFSVARGDHAHREPLQIAAVASLLVWAWLIPRWLRLFVWPAGSRRWLLAFLAWGGALLGSAVPMFLPGLLDRIKFTNALVGHAHLAMAGMASSFTALLLVVLDDRTRLRGALDDRAAFFLWHAGNVAQVAALVAAGALEAGDPGVVFRGDPAIAVLYGVRAVAGAAMLVAAVRWAARAFQLAGAGRTAA
jgi:cytochrome c oxidase cbb3-type subunit 1